MALKVGTEDKKKVIILAVLGAVLVIVAIYEYGNLFGGSAPPPTVSPTIAVQPVPTAAPATSSSGEGPAREAAKAPRVGNNLDPTLHPEIMAQAESLVYSGKGRNIFSMSSAPAVIEQVKAPIRQESEVAAPTGPPPPPPIELKFFGYSQQAAIRRAFLLHGDDVFIANEGDTVDHRYKVLKINPLSVEVTDLPYNNTQTLPFIPN